MRRATERDWEGRQLGLGPFGRVPLIGGPQAETQNNKVKREKAALAAVAQLVGVSSCKLKGCGFDPRSGHIPRLWVRP